MQQKVQFAGSLLHDPELVMLDEPFSGLDPVNSQVMKDVVIELAKSGVTVLFSTHIMEQAERMCDRIVIIARGEKVVDGIAGRRSRPASVAGTSPWASPTIARRRSGYWPTGG